MSKPMPYPTNPKEFTLKNLSLDLYIGVKEYSLFKSYMNSVFFSF